MVKLWKNYYLSMNPNYENELRRFHPTYNWDEFSVDEYIKSPITSIILEILLSNFFTMVPLELGLGRE